MASMYYTSGSVWVSELSMDNSGSLLFHHTFDLNGVLHAIACRVACHISLLSRMRAMMSPTRMHIVHDFAYLSCICGLNAAVIAVIIVA